MSKPITRQLDALLAISKEDGGQTALFNGLRGAVWIMVNGRTVQVRVWERLWELGELEHVEFDRGPKQVSVKVLRITQKGLQRLWDSGEEAADGNH